MSQKNCTPGEEVVVIPIPPSLLIYFDSPKPARVYPTWEIALKILFYIIAMLTDLVGNSLVIFIVVVSRRMRTTTNILLLNLAVADLLVCVLCMWVHLGSNITSEYPFDVGICKVTTFGQVTAITTSLLTQTVISIERFLAIIFPHRRYWTMRLTFVNIAVVWVIALGIASPQLQVRNLYEAKWKNRHVIQCVENWKKVYDSNCREFQPTKIVYRVLVTILMFLVPIIVMIICYTVICIRLVCRKAPGASDCNARAKKRVVCMLVVLLVVFTVCWMPLHIIELVEVFGETTTDNYTVRYIALYVAYLNSAINPVLYCGFNENFRRGFKDIFSCSYLPYYKKSKVLPASRKIHSGAYSLKNIVAPVCSDDLTDVKDEQSKTSNDCNILQGDHNFQLGTLSTMISPQLPCSQPDT